MARLEGKLQRLMREIREGADEREVFYREYRQSAIGRISDLLRQTPGTISWKVDRDSFMSGQSSAFDPIGHRVEYSQGGVKIADIDVNTGTDDFEPEDASVETSGDSGDFIEPEYIIKDDPGSVPPERSVVPYRQR